MGIILFAQLEKGLTKTNSRGANLGFHAILENYFSLVLFMFNVSMVPLNVLVCGFIAERFLFP